MCGERNLIGEQVHIPTTEEVLTEIQEATLQYISCADPKESAARKLRVIQSEARGDVERAAADIIATATARATHRYEMSPMTMTDAIPPQEIGTTSLAPIQAPLLLLGPGQEVESNDTTLLSATNPPQPTVGRKRGRPAKLVDSTQQLVGIEAEPGKIHQGTTPRNNHKQS